MPKFNVRPESDSQRRKKELTIKSKKMPLLISASDIDDIIKDRNYNAETLEALRETEILLKDPDHKTFDTFEEMVKDIHRA